MSNPHEMKKLVARVHSEFVVLCFCCQGSKLYPLVDMPTHRNPEVCLCHNTLYQVFSWQKSLTLVKYLLDETFSVLLTVSVCF